MTTLGWIATSSFGASLGVVLVTGLFVLGRSKVDRLVPVLLSFAVGTLLSGALLGLLPRALATGDRDHVLATTLGGLIMFFLLERCLVWRHCHSAECNVHSSSGPLIVVGDAFHNFVDGVMIATAFLGSVPTGLAVTLAVVAHEIPQELGDFGILLHYGYSRRRALILNSVSAGTTLVGSILGYLIFTTLERFIPYVLALSAASFLYIGIADLMPWLQRETRVGAAATQMASLLCGVATIVLLRAQTG